LKLDLDSFGAMKTKADHFEIPLAEENPEDAKLVRLALKAPRVKCTLRVIRDGAEAIEFLGSLEGNPKSPALDLFIVDINLPKRSGEDVLKCLCPTENHAQTLVVIISSLIAGANKASKHAAMVFQKP
jgi:DNA-binding response OmpR family regulator